MVSTVDFYKDAGLIIRIKHKGIFNLDGLFKVMRDWMVGQGYEFHEISVKHKVPSPSGAEQEFKFWGWKRVNEYIKFHIDVFMRIYDIKDVEVIKDGKKEMLSQAAIMIEFSARYDKDWSNRFKKGKFLRWLGRFYETYLMKEEIVTKWEDEIYYRIHKFARVIKDFLDFESKSNAYEDVW